MKCEAAKTVPMKTPAAASVGPENLRSISTANLRPQRRRRSSIGRIRLKREGGGGAACGTARRAGSPATPLLTWKFDGDDEDGGRGTKAKKMEKKKKQAQESGQDNGGGRKKGKDEKPAGIISSRRLAAGLWRLQPAEASLSGRATRRTLHRPVGSEAFFGHLGNSFRHEFIESTCGSEPRDRQSQSPVAVSQRMNKFCHKLESSVAFPDPAMERATKWDRGRQRTSDDVYRCYSQLSFIEDQREPSSSIVAVLQSELDLCRMHIRELEAERRSSKKKVDHFLRKLAEERASWRTREHEKIRLVIDGMKEDLNRERKHRQRAEIMNTKLVNELAEAKLTLKRFMQDYEKERKARELMEEVCDELAKEIADDKAEVEALKREAMKIREEVEEERKMLQMAEVWREERVQMKLVDAKLTLEDKYSQLIRIQTELEAVLKSGSTGDPRELKAAEILRNAISLVKIQDIKEFSYQPPTSEDVFSAFEDSGEANEKEIETCFGLEPDLGCCSPVSRSSKIHTVSPEVRGLNSHMQKYVVAVNRNGSVDDDGSVWDSGSQDEEQGSSNSPDGSDLFINGHHEGSNFSGSGTEWEENADNISASPEVEVDYSASGMQTKRKPSAVSRIWRSLPTNGDSFKAIPVEVAKGRISNRLMSPDRISGDGVHTPGSVDLWSSPDASNPRISGGTKGCIEWPRTAQRNSLKAKLLEARVESQKIQLRQALKQKI
ncbi:Uncharacterized protein EJ110_NYTH01034 [Nymphaea thermarum]|nr:Uncharacterized protein EJ110_NYTH01034 [Nymphaea thermarum]